MRYAQSLVRRVCDIAGQVTCIDDLRHDAIEAGLVAAVEDHDTGVIFDWLMWILSFQGISDAVADGYMDRHGNVTWAEIENVASPPTLNATSCRGIGRLPIAGTTRDSRPAPSRINSAIAPCPGIRCGTAGSTKLRTACFCSFATLPVATSLGGLISS